MRNNYLLSLVYTAGLVAGIDFSGLYALERAALPEYCR